MLFRSTFWHKPSGAAPLEITPVDLAQASRRESPPLPVIASTAEPALAHILVRRNRAWARYMSSLPVWVDGEKLTVLEDGQCDVILLPPGEHRVRAGTGTLFGFPEREISLQLASADHLVLEYKVDDAKWNSYGLKIGRAHV